MYARQVGWSLGLGGRDRDRRGGALLLFASVCVLLAGGSGRGAAPPARGPAKLWTGTIKAHEGILSSLAVSSDGHTLVTASDGGVALWDLRTGKLIRKSKPETYLRGAAFVTGQKELAGLTTSGDLGVIDCRSLRLRVVLESEPRDRIVSPAASPDGALVAGNTGAYLVGVTVWDVAKGKVRWQKDLDKDREFGVNRLNFSPDGKALAVAVQDARDAARLYDAATGRELRRFSLKEECFCREAAFSPDGRTLVTVYRDRTRLDVWDARSGELLHSASWQGGFRGGAEAVAFSPDGRTVFVSCRADDLRVYETATWGLREVVEVQAVKALPCPGGRIVWQGMPGRGVKGDAHVCSWRGEAKPGRRTDEEMARLWDDLGSKSARTAFKAIRELLATPEQAVALLAKLPRGELTAEQAGKLIAQLDDDKFAIRERASEQLGKAGHHAEAALRDAIAESPAEARRRARKLLAAIDPGGADRLRLLRAVEVLEALATPAAVKELERLAGGDARAALDRLRRRSE